MNFLSHRSRGLPGTLQELRRSAGNAKRIIASRVTVAVGSDDLSFASSCASREAAWTMVAERANFSRRSATSACSFAVSDCVTGGLRCSAGGTTSSWGRV
jgi:hypothetical protein